MKKDSELYEFLHTLAAENATLDVWYTEDGIFRYCVSANNHNPGGAGMKFLIKDVSLWSVDDTPEEKTIGYLADKLENNNGG